MFKIIFYIIISRQVRSIYQGSQQNNRLGCRYYGQITDYERTIQNLAIYAQMGSEKMAKLSTK